MARSDPTGEKRVYFFEAYVRVEATSDEEAMRRIQEEPTYVAESDTADGPDDAVQLVVCGDCKDSEPIVEAECICPPDLVARGGFKGGCRVHD